MHAKVAFRVIAPLLALIGYTGGASAVELGEKGKYGQIKVDGRLRYEYNERDTKPEDAHASTIRVRLGYLTPTWEGFSAYVEGETIQYLGEDNFDDGVNRRTNTPAINDPYDTGLNQLYLSYVDPTTGSGATIGRQVITLNNQRFIGRSNFRQNDTTYDAARFTLKPVKDLALDYIYFSAAHRSLGTRQTLGTYDGDFHTINATYKLPYDLNLAGYDFYNQHEEYMSTRSSNTYGARLEWKPKAEGKEITPFGAIEIAQQYDVDNNPINYSETYNWLELGAAYEGYSLSAVYERLGGNGRAAVQTPFGSVHNFNGWVDKFTTTPNTGLEDYSLFFKAPIKLPYEGQKLTFEAQLHTYRSTTDSQDYGDEVNFGFTYTPIENHAISFQGGRYNADQFSDDTTKLWLFYDFKF